MRALIDPRPLLTGAATWLDVRTAHGHLRHCRAEDYLVAVLYQLLREGSESTRELLTNALLAGLPRETRDSVAAAGPLTASYLWTQCKPDLALYAEDRRIMLVIEAKLAQGPSQACGLERLLDRYTPDMTLAPDIDLREVLAWETQLWQIDCYSLVGSAWVPHDLTLPVAEATWLFWTGSPTATAASAYPEAFTADHWQTSRHAETAAALRPLLRGDVFPSADEPWVDLLVRLLDVPWRGPRHPDSLRPLRLTSASA